MSKTSILIVEDEREIAELVQFHLQREGYSTQVVHSGRVALETITKQRPALVVLDLMLPDVGGLEVCRRLKWDAATRDVRILILSARGEEADIVTGLEMGADDYVTKPFSPRVLMARVHSVLRRGGAEEAPSESGQLRLAGGEVVIDVARHKVTVGGAEIELTLTEFGILRTLAQRPGFVRTRDQLIAAVHGGSTVLSSRTIDVHVTALRRKLGTHGDLIETVRGVGYRVAERTREPTG